MRKQMFEEMEEKLRAGKSPEDSLFYYHHSEDRIVLSHALFWVMTQSLKGKIAKEKNVFLLRKYVEEMLDAYLTEDAYFPELLRYCNIMFEFLPIILHHINNIDSDNASRKLATIAIVAAQGIRCGASPLPCTPHHLEELAASRHLDEHTGGRRKKEA